MQSQIIRRVEGSERQRAFSFIKQQFAEHFAAAIEDDTEELYAVMDKDGIIQAAFGLNHDPRKFFSRHYIGDALSVREAAFPTTGSTTGARRPGGIVELSHLCVRRPATLCRMIAPLATFLARRADYLVCTVTREVARFFQRKGLASFRVADARIDQLPPDMRFGWGDYYTHQPSVLLGKLADACRTLALPVYPREECPQSA